MKKLLLEEDDMISIQEEPIVPKIDELQIGNLISQLIRTEWDSVDLYNSILLTVQDEHRDDVEAILNDIIANHYINIGQLESVLQDVNSQSEFIDAGKEGTEEIES